MVCFLIQALHDPYVRGLAGEPSRAVSPKSQRSSAEPGYGEDACFFSGKGFGLAKCLA